MKKLFRAFFYGLFGALVVLRAVGVLKFSWWFLVGPLMIAAIAWVAILAFCLYLMSPRHFK